jgi:hypothetical protein
MFTDQLTGFDRQYATWNIYSVNSNNYGEFWADGLSAGVSQAQVAKAKAVEAGNAQIQGIAEILEGYYFAETALVLEIFLFQRLTVLISQIQFMNHRLL